MRRQFSAVYIYIVLWVFWMMFCVRYGFHFGLLGTEDKTARISTVLFACVFCPVIPVTLLKTSGAQIVLLTRIAAVSAAAGLAIVLFLDRTYIFAASVLLAAGSALFTSVVLYLYNYSLDRRGQVAGITLFLMAKPVVSALSVFLSGHAPVFIYMLSAAAAAAGLFLDGFYLGRQAPVENTPEPGGVRQPVWALLMIFLLYALFVFERMNGVFALYARRGVSSANYYLYFSGTAVAAAVSWWLFIRKGAPVIYAYLVFLASEIFHFALSIASSSSLVVMQDFDMVFFGVSDIIYVFLFIAAAVLSTVQPGKKLFVSFTCVFGLALVGGFCLAALLFLRFQNAYTVVNALVSLILIALSIVLAPVLIRLGGRRGKFLGELPAAEPARHAAARSGGPEHAPVAARQVSVDGLTAREREIVGLLVRGYSNKQISDNLHISMATVKVHSRNIYEKLDVHSRIELILLITG